LQYNASLRGHCIAGGGALAHLTPRQLALHAHSSQRRDFFFDQFGNDDNLRKFSSRLILYSLT
jgi:hypothetical protein